MLLAAFVTITLIASLLWWQRSQQTSSPAIRAKVTNGRFVPSKEQWAGIKTIEVKKLVFRTTIVTDGNIAFDDDAVTQVFSPYSGRVVRVFAKLGDVVKKGEPLMSVEASEIVQGESDVAVAKAVLDTARATEKRQHDLYEAGASATKEWRQAQSDLVTAEAGWAAARGRLHILGKTDAEMDALEATPARRAEAMVLAPIGGTVTQRQVGVGEYITSAANGGSSPACTIANLSKVWLMANVREDETPHLHVGQDVGVNVLALPGSMFKAIIVWVAAAVDPVTHRLAVRAEIPNPDGVLKPGMFASFNIATSSPTESLAVPQSAIIYDGEATRVLVVLGDGAITVRPVHIGRIREGMAEVSDGLHEGEKVVASGTLFVDQAAQGQ